MDNSNLRPVRKDVLRNRKRILVSARAVFSAQGMAATLDDVAHHAGVGVGTIYRHFPNKQDLVEAMSAELLDVILEVAATALEADDPWQGFTDFCAAMAEAFATDRGLYDVMLSSQLGGDDVAAARAKWLPLAERLVVRAQKSGQLRQDFTAAEFPLLHLMIGSVADYMQDTDSQAWRRYLAIFLEGLRTGPASDTLPVPPPEKEAVDAAGRQWQPRRPGSR